MLAVEVYSDWARNHVVDYVNGIHQGRWDVDGRVVDDVYASDHIQDPGDWIGPPDGRAIAARLAAGVTDAVARVLGEQERSGGSVELVATPEVPTGIGSVIAE